MHQWTPTNRPLRGRTAWLTAVGVLALTLSACQDAVGPEHGVVKPLSSAARSAQVAGEKIPDEYIIVFNNSVTDVSGRANALLKAHGGALTQTYSSALKGFAAHMSANAAEAISNDAAVDFVEANQVVEVASTQTGAQWGLDRIDQATLPLDGNYNYSQTGAGVNVYIIDSGIRSTHSQFGGRVVPAYSAVNDGYGPDGCQWHGTHVAGIVGGSTTGVAKSVTLHSVRITDCSGTTDVGTMIAGIDWVTANHRSPAVATLSLSTGLSSALNAAVESSINSGVTYVVAAGNNVNSDACNFSPASVPGALTVASIGGNDAQTTYTNVGGCVDLYAPGTNIYSAINTDDNALALYSGTSQSAGFVAGAAALYLQGNPSASPASVASAIVSSATSGVVTSLTGGTPNLLLRVNGSGGGTGGDPLPPPPPPPPPGNTAPVASFTSNCAKAKCTYNGSASKDDAGIVSYSWNFGDGATGTGSSAVHTYSARGTYTVTVTLVVTDAAGLTGRAQKSVTIKNGR